MNLRAAWLFEDAGRRERLELTADERHGLRTAVHSVFRRLAKLAGDVWPVYDRYGFSAPSVGVMARDLSEKIEAAIVQHCDTFTKGAGHADLGRFGECWEVKVCSRGLTINQSKVITGEQYIVCNYVMRAGLPYVDRIWVLWAADDAWFSPRRSNSNARRLLVAEARDQIEEIEGRP